MRARLPTRLIICVLLLYPDAATLAAQEPDTGWTFSAQLSGVWAAGNAESSTFGLGSTLINKQKSSELKLEAGGIRTDAARTTRRAIGTAAAFRIEEQERRETTAESYFARGRYDRAISSRSVVFVGLDVLRNTFAGIDSRTLVAAGAGNVWIDRDDVRFKTDYGVTYTFQHDVVENPFTKTNFPGARVGTELRWRLTATTRLESTLTSDLNFSDTDDVRIDFNSSLPVAVSSAISLKPSLQLLWRNQPALREVDLFLLDGTPAGARVTVPFEKLDTFFTLALVVTL